MVPVLLTLAWLVSLHGSSPPSTAGLVSLQLLHHLHGEDIQTTRSGQPCPGLGSVELSSPLSSSRASLPLPPTISGERCPCLESLQQAAHNIRLIVIHGQIH